MDVRETTLSNGLPLLVVPIEGTQAVTTYFLVGAGAMHEPQEALGTAHFLEHMAFKGTKKRPSKRALAEEFDSMGAHYNAHTSQEYIGYYIKTAARHHERAMDILGDIVLHSTLPEEEVEREKGVIIEELRMMRDNPMQHIGYRFLDLVYAPHPFGRNIVGTEESLQNMRRDDLQKFFDTFFSAGNALVAVVGAVDMEEAERLAEQCFSSLKGGGAVPTDVFVTTQKGPRVRIDERSIDQTHLWLGVPGVRMSDERWPVASLLATVLGGNMSSRLFLKIREERGLAYHVSTGSWADRNTGLVATQAGVRTSNLREAIEAIIMEHRRLKTELVSDAELQRAKEYWKGSRALSLEESNDIAYYIAEERLLNGAVLLPKEEFQHIDAVTADDIQCLAQEVFVPERMNLAMITAGTVDEDDLQTVLAAV